MKLLERDVAARYRTAAAAIADLHACADAAQDGRDQLIEILAERFAPVAPVRKNRSRPDGVIPVHLATTLPHGGTPPHSLGVARAAPTIAARRRSVSRVVIVTLVVGIAGVLAYAIVRHAARAEKGATIAPAMHSGTP